MMRYKNAVDLRRALEDRLKRKSGRTGSDLGRLQRRVLFDRLAVRLALDGRTQWILTGGAALELRLRDRARAAKDVDLALAAGAADGPSIRELLIGALAGDPDRDCFSFRVCGPTAPSQGAGSQGAGSRGAWRFSVDAWLAGKTFGGVRLDVAARGEELGATEQLELPGSLRFAGIPARSIEVVEPPQHFAEKLHALTRDYGDRPNTRVKDLLDLVLLIEDGLAPDIALVRAVCHVFTVRATHPYPTTIPDPPPPWRTEYARLAQPLTETSNDLAHALKLLRGFWERALDRIL